MQIEALLIAIVIDADLEINRLPDFFSLLAPRASLLASLLIHIPSCQRYNSIIQTSLCAKIGVYIIVVTRLEARVM